MIDSFRNKTIRRSIDSMQDSMPLKKQTRMINKLSAKREKKKQISGCLTLLPHLDRITACGLSSLNQSERE